jgi:hypothetical protein
LTTKVVPLPPVDHLFPVKGVLHAKQARLVKLIVGVVRRRPSGSPLVAY